MARVPAVNGWGGLVRPLSIVVNGPRPVKNLERCGKTVWSRSSRPPPSRDHGHDRWPADPQYWSGGPHPGPSEDGVDGPGFRFVRRGTDGTLEIDDRSLEGPLDGVLRSELRLPDLPADLPVVGHCEVLDLLE